MREIKFRAWNEVEEKIYNWYEFLNTNMKNTFIAPESTGMILMQYTGLQDRNGKEIYEGDILKFKMYDGKYENYKIIFRNAEFEAINEEDTNFISADIWNVYGEVIGNIYENPELLEDKE